MSRVAHSVTAALIIGIVSVGGFSAFAQPQQSERIRATYEVTLGGLRLGQVLLTAVVEPAKYEIEAQGEFSLMRGILYRAKGKTSSAGFMTDVGPAPTYFTVEYEGREKRETRQLNFDEEGVSEVTIAPRKRRGPKTIPVTERQLNGVLDPLTAAFLAARPDCDQTVPVFDGKQRFDLVLTPKRTATLDDTAPRQITSTAAVCRVRYKPISGYNPGHAGVKYMTENKNMELWVVSVPHARLSLPYRVSIATPLGTGSATLTSIQ